MTDTGKSPIRLDWTKLIIFVAGLIFAAGVFYATQLTQDQAQRRTVDEHSAQIGDLLSWARSMSEAQGRIHGDIAGLIKALEYESEARRSNTERIKELEHEMHRRR